MLTDKAGASLCAWFSCVLFLWGLAPLCHKKNIKLKLNSTSLVFKKRYDFALLVLQKCLTFPAIELLLSVTTVCVWCGTEFNHVAVNSEIQSDSVGFMCPVCQAKVPLQINVLENGSPNAGNL
ncbi:unnamed protein product [Trifolium pratense]|uniref:Uncharacterized protein n=1 Tax=Trifolium pratense TaxID=57577 RepID=A0ACB0JVQ7_TRIPR|nr:unnamed protein product [Trifolium pratense]